MNAELLTYLVCQMIHATEAKDRRTSNDILISAIAAAQTAALAHAANR
jgi:hypothetical protein